MVGSPRVTGLFLLIIPAVLSTEIQGQKDRSWQSLRDEIVRAQERAVQCIRNAQKEDGSFPLTRKLEKFPTGVASLCLLALLESGVSSEDRDVREALDFILKHPPRKTYSTAFRIMALDALRNKKVQMEEDIRASATWLEDNFRSKGDVNRGDIGWAYPEGRPDLSIIQQAAFALHLAGKYGFDFKKENWRKLAKQVMRYQNKDGGFGYHPRRSSTGSMTSAAITVLTLCEMNGKAPGVRAPIARGWDYLEKRFLPFVHFEDKTYTYSHYVYYLASLERACALGEKKTLLGQHWYQDCARELVKAQGGGGGWFFDISDTALGLLFLGRAGHKAIGAGDEAVVKGDMEVFRHQARPGRAVPFVKNWLIVGPFESKSGVGLEASHIDEARFGSMKFKLPGNLRIKKLRSTSRFIDLNRTCRGDRGSAAYAFTCFDLKEKTPVCFWVTPDDCSRMWIDGEVVGDFHLMTWLFPDRYCIRRTLEKGKHRLLVKVANLGGGWGLILRICHENGRPIAHLVPHIDRKGPTDREFFDARAGNRSLKEAFALIPVDEKPELRFGAEKDLDRTYFLRSWKRIPFTWVKDAKGLKGARPPTGAKGMICVHPPDQKGSALVLRKIKIKSRKAKVVVRIAACAPDYFSEADFKARVGVYTIHEGSTKWLGEFRAISATRKSAPMGWVEIRGDLAGYAGKEVLLVLECAAGGPLHGWHNEHAFIDEFSVKHNR